MARIRHLLGKKKNVFISIFSKYFCFLCYRSYSNTRTVAPTTTRSLRSPTTALKTSDTMRSQDTNISSADSNRQHTRPIGITPTTTINQPAITTDATISATPNDVYQQVYHDDSSTHGSRTLDSRFSRDKYDLSDGGSTDDDDEEDHVQEPTTEPAQKPVNGSSSPPIATISLDDNQEKAKTETEQTINSNRIIELDELDKGKSPGTDEVLYKDVHHDEEEEEEENYSESNHKKENRVSLEIYHNATNKKNEDNTNEIGLVKRYSASLKMYLNARHSSGGSRSICVPSTFTDTIDDDDEEEQKLLFKGSQQQQRSHSLQMERTVSMDFTHSPSSSSSSSLKLPPIERLIGSKPTDEVNEEFICDNISPSIVIEIRAKPHSLPRMTDFVDYVDRRTLPSADSLSWQDDTIAIDQSIPIYEKNLPTIQ